jgi:hypothetical protein
MLIGILTLIFSFYTHTGGYTSLMAGVLGLLLLLTWFIRSFALYSGRRVSRYSEVIQRISIKDRFFAYFILPSLFYISLLFFLFYNSSAIIEYVMIAIVMVQIAILFLNVRSSFSKIYSLQSHTKAIFDFICISIFFLVESVLVRMGFDFYLFTLSSFILTFILLLFDLKLHNKGGLSGILMGLLSSLFVMVFISSFWTTNIFVIPSVGTLAYYLVISLWNVRFSGKVKFTDYIAPFIYSVLALILILNL